MLEEAAFTARRPVCSLQVISRLRLLLRISAHYIHTLGGNNRELQILEDRFSIELWPSGMVRYPDTQRVVLAALVISARFLGMA